MTVEICMLYPNRPLDGDIACGVTLVVGEKEREEEQSTPV